MTASSIPHTHIALIGAGIMSATLGTLLKQLAPEKSITVFERLGAPALESGHGARRAVRTQLHPASRRWQHQHQPCRRHQRKIQPIAATVGALGKARLYPAA